MSQSTIEFASEAVKNQTLALDCIERFYGALNGVLSNEPSAMNDVLADVSDAMLMGPFGGRQAGASEIRSVFHRDASLKSGGQVTPRDLLVRVGSEMAYSVCIERGQITTSTGKTLSADLRATNIARPFGDQWRIVYHHTDPSPPMQEASSLKYDDFSSPRGLMVDSSLMKAVDQFFSALRSMFSGDVGPLGRIWANTDDATLSSPVGNLRVGYSSIINEFKGHAGLNITGTLEYKNLYTRTCGDMAYASCLALAPDMTINGKPFNFNQRATTIFRLECGKWRVVHHHSDLAPGLVELCGQ